MAPSPPPRLRYRLPKPRLDGGFTLLEILISLGLSLFIIITVYTCFRVATQTVATCNRLSLENRLVIAGLMAAVDETDSWNSFDNPLKASEQPLRVTPTMVVDSAHYYDESSGALPQPFTPFSQSWTTALCGVPQTPDNPNLGGDSFFSPDWLPSDQRTWYRNDAAFATYSWGQFSDQSAFGDYAHFTKSSNGVPRATFIEWNNGIPLSTTMDVGIGTVGNTDPRFTWYADQHKGLMYALGWYGWLDYLPANAICDFNDNVELGRASPNGIHDSRPGRQLVLRAQDNGDMNNMGPFGHLVHQGDDRVYANRFRACSRGSFLFGTMVGIDHYPLTPVAPLPAPAASDVQSNLQMNRRMGGNGGFNAETIAPVADLMNRLHWGDNDRPSHLLPSQPDLWPTVTIEVRRFMKYQRTTNLCFVRLTDPVSTKAIEIVFTATGTTLRGARLARGLDSP